MNPFVAVAALLLASSALAQSGVILGTVQDVSSKQPVSDVIITATSPSLEGEQVVVSDANGQYRIPELPEGDYVLRFEKESFQPYSRAGLQLREGRTLRVNVEQLPTGVTDVIIMTCAGSTIDPGSASTVANIGQDYMRLIPLHR